MNIERPAAGAGAEAEVRMLGMHLPVSNVDARTITFRVMALLVVFGLAACAGSPSQIVTMGGDALRDVEPRNLCGAYRLSLTEGNPNVRAEIERRALISDVEWDLVTDGGIVRGMSECAVLATLGPPTRIAEGESGENRRYVFHYPGDLGGEIQTNEGTSIYFDESGNVIVWR